MQGIEALFIGFGLLSCLASGSIVLTGLVFPSIMLNNNNPYSKIIFIISLCDLMGCVGVSFGFPTASSPLCPAQAFLGMFFFPASWLWTVCLLFQLRCIILHKKLFLTMQHLHAICWTASAIIALLPLSNDRYGLNDDLSGEVFCFLSGRQGIFWILGLYYFTLFACISLMIVFLVQIRSHYRAKILETTQRERALIKAIVWYPIGLIMCWFGVIVASLTYVADPSSGVITFIEVAEVIATQYGTVRTIIFFSSSKIIRNHWLELLGMGAQRERISSSRLTGISNILSIDVEPRSSTGSSILLSDIFDSECSVYHGDRNSRGDSTDQMNRDSDGNRTSVGFSIQLREFFTKQPRKSEDKSSIDVVITSPMQN